MDSAVFIDMGRDALLLVLIIAGPIMMTALFIGLLISLFQAVTQIQEQTLTFVPKLVAVVLLLGILLPWMLQQAVDYTVRLFQSIPGLVT